MEIISKPKLISLIVALIAFAFLIGYVAGSVATMTQCVNVGVKVLEESGFEISPTIINDVLTRYGEVYLKS